jgi:hypothetical protein
MSVAEPIRGDSNDSMNSRSCPEMTTLPSPLTPHETAGCTVIVTPGRCSDMAGSPIASLKAER